MSEPSPLELSISEVFATPPEALTAPAIARMRDYYVALRASWKAEEDSAAARGKAPRSSNAKKAVLDTEALLALDITL